MDVRHRQHLTPETVPPPVSTFSRAQDSFDETPPGVRLRVLRSHELGGHKRDIEWLTLDPPGSVRDARTGDRSATCASVHE